MAYFFSSENVKSTTADVLLDDLVQLCNTRAIHAKQELPVLLSEIKMMTEEEKRREQPTPQPHLHHFIKIYTRITKSSCWLGHVPRMLHRASYAYAIAVSLGVHCWTLYNIQTSNSIDFKGAFVPSLFAIDFSHSCHIFLQWDAVFTYGAAILWGLSAFKQVGKKDGVQIDGQRRAGLDEIVICLLGACLFSPGAVLAGIFWKREEKIWQMLDNEQLHHKSK